MRIKSTSLCCIWISIFCFYSSVSLASMVSRISSSSSGLICINTEHDLDEREEKKLPTAGEVFSDDFEAKEKLVGVFPNDWEAPIVVPVQPELFVVDHQQKMAESNDLLMEYIDEGGSQASINYQVFSDGGDWLCARKTDGEWFKIAAILIEEESRGTVLSDAGLPADGRAEYYLEWIKPRARGVLGKVLQAQRVFCHSLTIEIPEEKMLALTKGVISFWVYKSELKLERDELAKVVMDRNPRLSFEALSKNFVMEALNGSVLSIEDIERVIREGADGEWSEAYAHAIANYMKNTVNDFQKQHLLRELTKLKASRDDFWLFLSSWVYYKEDTLLSRLCQYLPCYPNSNDLESDSNLQQGAPGSVTALYEKTTRAIITSVTYQLLEGHGCWVAGVDKWIFLMSEEMIVEKLKEKGIKGRGKHRIINFVNTKLYCPEDTVDVQVKSDGENNIDLFSLSDEHASESLKDESVSKFHVQEKGEKVESNPLNDKEPGELDLLNQSPCSENGGDRAKRKRRASFKALNSYEGHRLEGKIELTRRKLANKPSLRVTPLKSQTKKVKVNNPESDCMPGLTLEVEKIRSELAQKNSHSHQQETEPSNKLETESVRMAQVYQQPADEPQRGYARETLNSNSQNVMSSLNHIPAHTQSRGGVHKPKPVYPRASGYFQCWGSQLAVQNHLPADINPWRHLNAAPAMSTQYVAPSHSSIMPEQMYGAYVYNFQALQPMTDRHYLDYFYFWALQNQARSEEISLANVNSDAARVSTPTVPMIHTAVSEEPSKLDCDSIPISESNPIEEDSNRNYGFGGPVFPGMI